MEKAPEAVHENLGMVGVKDKEGLAEREQEGRPAEEKEAVSRL